MNRRRWSMRVCPMARVSTRSFRRSRSMARRSRFVVSARSRYTIDDLVDKGYDDPGDASTSCRPSSRARLNMIVCGGTGSGKTTMLNCLSAFIPGRRTHRHDRGLRRTVAAAAARREAGNAAAQRRRQGRGHPARTGARTALRMRPDRIILGEVRGAEVMDMLQAMSTGHDGSIATHPRQQSARMPGAPRNDDAAVGRLDSAARDAPADRVGLEHDRPRQPALRRYAQSA